ncbi:MAG: hypothetical protein N4A46_03120 [Schleiferiaceae bacterium]|jgi:hypothetical protein|nr:hypothetical protein [Schleiferiaceae bacterium]
MKTTKFLAFLSITASLVFTSCKDEGTGGTPDTSTIFDTQILGDETITTITDRGEGIGTMTLESTTTWVLNGLVFVNAGQTLTVEEGTVIKGTSGQGENASALIVARNAKIMACGTSANPIIFTSESDQIRRKADDTGFENGGNLPADARGLWGGLIVLGNAILNSEPGTSAIEGIPTNEKRGLYGGNDDADNSGQLCYISIRHGGTDIGSGNEINGLTLGGVGNATNINHVEVIANADDGIECFGGVAPIKHAVITNVGDDAFDYDEGYRGNVQYLLIYHAGDRGGEHDGGTSPEDGTPFATPTFANVTSIGRGVAAGKRTITFRDNAGGFYWNSIFTEYGKGIDIEDLGSGEHSLARLNAGDLMLMHNLFENVNDDMIENIIVDNSDNDLSAHPNVVGNSVTPLNMNGVLPGAIPNAIWTGFTKQWFDQPAFRGAFNPDGSDNWHEGWTLTDEATVIQ